MGTRLPLPRGAKKYKNIPRKEISGGAFVHVRKIAHCGEPLKVAMWDRRKWICHKCSCYPERNGMKSRDLRIYLMLCRPLMRRSLHALPLGRDDRDLLSAILIGNQSGQGGDFVGGALLTSELRQLGVDPALEPSADLQPVPGVAGGSHLGSFSPEDAW